MKGSDVLFSSENTEWRTPPDLYAALDAQFHFTLDAAATLDNSLCSKCFTQEIDALQERWFGRVYCNPPYGRTVDRWVYYACNQSKALVTADEIIVMLLPARTDRIMFHDCIMKHAAEVRFLRGRLNFSGHKDPAGFPSMVVVWAPGRVGNRSPDVWCWDWKNDRKEPHKTS